MNPFTLPKEKGIIDATNVRLVEYTSMSKVLSAYRNKQIDAAAVTLYDALLLLDEGFSPKVVLIMDVSHGGDVIISQKDLPQFQDLKGKTVGLEKSAMGIQVLARSLEVNHMTLQDIKVKMLEGFEHERAFKEKKIDALVTYEPIRSKLLQQGAQEVFTSKEMPNEIIDVLIIRKEYLETHLEEIAELTDKWYQALAFYKEHPKESKLIFSKRLNLNAKDLDSVFEGLIIPSRQQNLEFFNPSVPSLITISKEMEKLMIKNKYLKKSIDIESLIDYDRSLFIRSDKE